MPALKAEKKWEKVIGTTHDAYKEKLDFLSQKMVVCKRSPNFSDHPKGLIAPWLSFHLVLETD